MARPLEALFSPRSIAVVGASRRRDSIGFALLHNLVMSEFEGVIFPVNPEAGAIHSLKAYPRIGAIPDPVDLAVVAVPRDSVPAVIEDCLAHGVRGLVVITAGFAETGADGARLERELRIRVRSSGARMIGPNCMGIINADPAISMNATFAPTPARRGSIGFVSQSGALGVAILNVAADLGIGLTQFASMGNKADVSGNDILEYWEDDPATRVICMYLESFGNPRRFTEIAKRVGRKKPILVVKSGRTAAGARAATSHTGALAGTDVNVSTFLSQCGVLRADTIEELFDVARALDGCPLSPGNRVAVLTNAGGPAIMATDALVNLGLGMATPSAATLERLSAFLPPEASLANPIDMIASATAEDYRRALRSLLDDANVDMVLAINVTPLLSNPIDILAEIGAVARASSDKPVLAVMMATEDFYDEVKSRPDLPPVYRFPESAARVLAHLDRYAAWRRRPAEVERPAFEVDDRAVADLLDGSAGGYLPSADAFRVLERYGIPVVPWHSASTPAEAAVAAADLGFPVALKAEASGLVHKSDVGAVRLGLDDAGLVSAAALDMETSLAGAGHQLVGYLVQAMATGGHEVLFGASTDPRFGPILAFGLGGRYVEVLQDVRFGVPPLARDEARQMIEGIRGAALLRGVRGEPSAELESLVEVLLRLSQLVRRHPRIEELDINPFLAAPTSEASRALDVRIRVAAPAVSPRPAVAKEAAL